MEKTLDLGIAMQQAGTIINDFKTHKTSFLQFAQQVVVLVENYAKEVAATAAAGAISGKDKKEIVLDILCAAITIPLVPAGLERFIFGFVIDQIVAMLNKTGWVKI